MTPGGTRRVEELGPQHSPSHPACHDLGYERDTPFSFLVPDHHLVPRMSTPHPDSLIISHTHKYTGRGVRGVMQPEWDLSGGLAWTDLRCFAHSYLRVYVARGWEVLMTTALAPASKATETFLTLGFL